MPNFTTKKIEDTILDETYKNNYRLNEELVEKGKQVKENEDKECDKVIYLKLSKSQIDEKIKYASEENIQAKLDIIMHNQFVLNEKLKKIICLN